MRQYRDTQFYVTESGEVFRQDTRYADNRLVPAKLRPMSSLPYLRVTDYRDGKSVDYNVHVMVMECYGVPCPGVHGRNVGEYNIHHVDEDKTNNHITNLQWIEHGEHTQEHNPPTYGKYVYRHCMRGVDYFRVMWRVKGQRITSQYYDNPHDARDWARLNIPDYPD